MCLCLPASLCFPAAWFKTPQRSERPRRAPQAAAAGEELCGDAAEQLVGGCDQSLMSQSNPTAKIPSTQPQLLPEIKIFREQRSFPKFPWAL